MRGKDYLCFYDYVRMSHWMRREFMVLRWCIFLTAFVWFSVGRSASALGMAMVLLGSQLNDIPGILGLLKAYAFVFSGRPSFSTCS